MPQKFMLIACEILHREICLSAAHSKNIIDMTFLNKGLHDIGAKLMQETLQKSVDGINVQKYDAILLGYGLCNYGVSGMVAKIPMVIPKAHDCITLFMGSKEKYRDYFDKNPGTFFRTAGWLERADFGIDGAENVMSQLGIQPDMDFSEYGEENAEYLKEMLGNWIGNYSKQTFIDTHVGNPAAYEKIIQEDTVSRGLEYERIEGSIKLIQRLMDGDWDEADFLVVPPGGRILATHDDGIMGYQEPQQPI